MYKEKIYKYTSLSSITILIISSLFSLLVGLGLYGYGMDYYGAYSKGFEWNDVRVEFFTYLGFRIATLTIFGFHIGVYITTFILSLSTGFLMREHMKSKQSYSLIIFLILFLITIHTWPVIMSTSNAMRQGLAMSFIFLTLISSSRKNYYWMIFFSIFAILNHKTGFLLAMIIIFASILDKLFTTFSHKAKVIINFLIGIILLFITYYSIKNFILPENFKPSRIIAGDFRGAFVFIAFIYVVFSIFYKGILDNSFNLSLYYFGFISLGLLMNGLNWQYERLGMMMIIPYILSLGVIFNRPSYKLYLVLTFLLLFLLTIYTGMYTEGLFYPDNIFIYSIINS
jgi:hypothetical protein